MGNKLSATSIDVRGDINRLWELASDVPQWAAILPHYRYVTVLAENGPQRTLVMAAKRGQIPIRWVAVLEPLPAERRILFQHIGGGARGMLVEWQIVQHDGFVRATINHDLRRLSYPIVDNPLGRYILAEQFIEPVARRTLACMKEMVERETGTGADASLKPADGVGALRPHA